MARAYARQGDGWMDGWLVGWLVGDVVAMPTSPSTLVSSLSIHSPFLFARLSVDTVRPRRSISGHLFASSARALIVIYGFSVMLSRRTRRSCQSRVEPPPPRAARWDSAFKTPAGRNGDTTASLCTVARSAEFFTFSDSSSGTNKRNLSRFLLSLLNASSAVRHVTLPQSLQHGARRGVARPRPVVVSSKV